CCSTSALGLRSPRSIWLRYGLDTPAASASCRSDNCALRRCSRRYSPRLPTLSDAMPPLSRTALTIASNPLAEVCCPFPVGLAESRLIWRWTWRFPVFLAGRGLRCPSRGWFRPMGSGGVPLVLDSYLHGAGYGGVRGRLAGCRG